MNNKCFLCKEYPIKRILYPDNLNCFCEYCIMTIASESLIKKIFEVSGEVEPSADTEGICSICEKSVYLWQFKGCFLCKNFYCIDCRSTHVRDHIRKITAREVLGDYLLDDIVNYVVDGYLL